MNVLSNIKKYYVFSFFLEFMFIIPVITLFWQENGLSLSQIMLLQSIYALSIVLWEVPTGVFADKVGRKNSLIIGTGFLVFGSLIYSLGYNFLQFAIAEIIWGLGFSFMSGANSAFIYDSLKQSKKEKDFKKVWGNAKSWGYLAAGVSGIIGGLVAVYSKRLDWVLVAIGMLIAFFIALSFKEPKHYEKVTKKGYWKHTFECFKEAFTNKNILFLLIFNSLIAANSRIGLWFFQPYMNQSGIPIFLFGIIWASFTIFAILGSKSADRVDNYLGERKSLWLIICLITFSFIFMGFWSIPFGFIFIYMLQFVRGFSPVVIQDYTNKHLSQGKRATLLSIQSLVGSLLFAIIGPFYGALADKSSLSYAMFFTSISFFLAFLVLMIWNKLRKKD